MIAWAIETILSTTILMLLVLACRKPVAQLFGAEWAYALWLLPVVVPLLPELPSLSAEPAFTLLLPPVDGVGAPAAAPAGGGTAGEWLLLLLAAWAGGAAFFAIWQQSAYSAFMLHLGPQGRAAIPPSYGGIKVVESDAVEGPVALGVFNRRIVVPLDFGTRYSAAEQRLALEHELIHHRRFDILWNWVALGMVTLNWFNPIAHFAFRAFRIDQELACDAAVMRRSPAHRHDYACALVKSASHPGVIAVCPLNRAEFLKRRLRMMKQHRASWARNVGGVGSIAFFGLIGVAFGTPGFAQSEPALPGKIAVNRPSEPIISKTEVARLREKCGRDDRHSRAAIVCSDDEARDPEVRAIVDRTMKRAEAHVQRATRAIQKAKVEAAVARAAAAAAAFDASAVARNAELAARIESGLRAHRYHRHSAEQSRRAREALARARVQLARIDSAAHQKAAKEAIKASQVHMAHLDFDKTIHTALASAAQGVRMVRVSLSAEDRQELERELAEARRDAMRDAAEARRDAQRDAAEARREALREALEAKREALQEAEEARRELAREMRELERELRSVPTPPAPRSAPAPRMPAVPPAPSYH